MRRGHGLRTSPLLPYPDKHYILFSKEGFTDNMKRLAEEDDAVRLVSFDDEAYVRFTVTRGGCFRGVPPSL